MGTVPMATVDAAMMARRIAPRSPPVERSMIVSVPAAMETRTFSNSWATSARSFEVPTLALTFVRRPLPMAMAAIDVCLLLRTTTMVPSSTPFRMVSGSTLSCFAQKAISSEMIPLRAISNCVCLSFIAFTFPVVATLRDMDQILCFFFSVFAGFSALPAGARPSLIPSPDSFNSSPLRIRAH